MNATRLIRGMAMMCIVAGALAPLASRVSADTAAPPLAAGAPANYSVLTFDATGSTSNLTNNTFVHNVTALTVAGTVASAQNNTVVGPTTNPNASLLPFK